MSGTEHTPGPWRVDGSGIRVRTADANGGPRSGREGGNQLICTVAECFMDSEQRSDNALLIAAAPELLACLLAYVELEESAAPYSSSPMREDARAAIAKARGTP